MVNSELFDGDEPKAVGILSVEFEPMTQEDAMMVFTYFAGMLPKGQVKTWSWMTEGDKRDAN